MAPREERRAKPGRVSRSRHYGIERWVDFVRGVAPGDEALEMTNHLAECPECHELMIFCAKLAAIAHDMSPL